MNTIFTNEKLGMQVEQVRLAEIRQEIEARRLAADVQEQRFGIGTLLRAFSTFAASRNKALSSKLLEQNSTSHTAPSQMGVFEK